MAGETEVLGENLLVKQQATGWMIEFSSHQGQEFCPYLIVSQLAISKARVNCLMSVIITK
jgi:hypothetical protein